MKAGPAALEVSLSGSSGLRRPDLHGSSHVEDLLRSDGEVARGCLHCGLPLPAGRRVYCTATCCKAHAAGKTVTCAPCGGEFRVSFASTTRTCSRRCGGVARRKSLSKCKHCGGPTFNPVSDFCSQRCHQDSVRDAYLQRWFEGEESGTTPSGYLNSTVAVWVRTVRGEKCWECGWCVVHPSTGRVPVQIDHVDGDSLNNTRANLRLLCPNCHSLTPTFGNIGGRTSSRTRRYGKALRVPPA